MIEEKTNEEDEFDEEYDAENYKKKCEEALNNAYAMLDGEQLKSGDLSGLLEGWDDETANDIVGGLLYEAAQYDRERIFNKPYIINFKKIKEINKIEKDIIAVLDDFGEKYEIKYEECGMLIPDAVVISIIIYSDYFGITSECFDNLRNVLNFVRSVIINPMPNDMISIEIRIDDMLIKISEEDH